jgi:hypothetical protein
MFYTISAVALCGSPTKCYSSKTWIDDETIKILKEKFNQQSKWEKEDV